MLTSAWTRGEPVGHLTLDHQQDDVKIAPIFKQSQQNFRSNEVGKISDNADRLRFPFQPRTGASGLRSKQGMEIDRENVALDDFLVRRQREIHALLWGQVPIEFDGDQATGSLCQTFG